MNYELLGCESLFLLRRVFSGFPLLSLVKRSIQMIEQELSLYLKDFLKATNQKLSLDCIFPDTGSSFLFTVRTILPEELYYIDICTSCGLDGYQLRTVDISTP